MCKRRRDCSTSFGRCGRSPLPHISHLKSEATCSSPPTTEAQMKEWEDARCPVCMEHPHNVVLLICSAYSKGCRPYMCDTSHRHSNCLDQFCKSFAEASNANSLEEGQPQMQTNSQEDKTQAPNNFPSMHRVKQKLVCPLCRGQISGWVVVQSAREFMNAKTRSCACETCDFTGNYGDLRKHARVEHPQVWPSEADPERQQNWRALERQRHVGDMLSIIRSSFGVREDDEDRGEQNSGELERQEYEEFDVIVNPPLGEHDGLLTVTLLVWHPESRRSSWPGMARPRLRRRVPRQHRNEAHVGYVPVEENDSSSGNNLARHRSVRRRTSTPDDEI